jgi:release factor glutamine methyltransferase
MSPLNLGEALKAAAERIGATDARVLLAHVTGRNAAYLIANPETGLRQQQETAYRSLVDRRQAGEPVAYLTGEREFYGRPFKVSPAVLIPRPETELLVDLALERIGTTSPARILDVGTGSGCVAIAIASERSHCKIVALDQSYEALAVARRNAFELRVGNVAFLQSNWFEALRDEHFDLIVSNPPYVAAEDPHLGAGDLRFEPRAALESGPDGLEAIRHLAAESAKHLAPGGWLLVEHGHDQGAAVRGLFEAAGYAEVFSETDLADIERVTGGRLTVPQSGR